MSAAGSSGDAAKVPEPRLKRRNSRLPLGSGAKPDARAKKMISRHKGKYCIMAGDNGKYGTWTYTPRSDTAGILCDENGEKISTFSYDTVGRDVFEGTYTWDTDPDASTDMKCIGVTSSEVMEQIQDPSSQFAYFVLPSQLNGAEYPSHDYVVQRLQDYCHDNTGGPRGQLAVHPAAGQFVLDNAAHVKNPSGINAVDGILDIASSFKLRNGYMELPRPDSDNEAVGMFNAYMACLPSLRPLMMHGVRACGLLPSKKGLSEAKHTVGLVYASAVPVNAYMNKARSFDENKLHKKVAEVTLVAQYYGALRAIAKARQHIRRNTKVYLLPLGGGVFNNSWESIARAMAQAVELLAKEPKLFDKVNIEALAWKGNPTEATTLKELLSRHNKFFDKETGQRYKMGNPKPPQNLNKRREILRRARSLTRAQSKDWRAKKPRTDP